MDAIRQDLHPELILSHLGSSARAWVRELRVHLEIDSTNSHLMRRALVEDVDGVACLAERQTNGRGRRGRTWLTPAGAAIALSLGRRVSVAIADVAPLSLVVGLAVARAMHSSGITGVSLKWPNDVLLDGAKVAGVLIELASGSNPVMAVIGVGINVGSGMEVRAHIGTPVGDVLDRNRHVSRNVLAANVIDSVHELTANFESSGFSRMRREWERLHAHQGEIVRVTSAASSVEGVALGVTPNGELILETQSGVANYSGGEVSLRAVPR